MLTPLSVLMLSYSRYTSSAAALRAKGATAAAGWVGGYCENMLGGRWVLYPFDTRCCHGHKQNGLKSIFLRWSTTTKQLSRLSWQNEYWRRPISAGTRPSLMYHGRPEDWSLRLSLLIWFITQSVKDKSQLEGAEVCTSPHYTDRQSIIVLSLPSKINWDLHGRMNPRKIKNSTAST